MKIKIILIIFLVVLLIISISQIFDIPPYEDDVFQVYKSGYFSELEKGFSIIKDSFLSIKMMSKPVFAWVFLEDIKEKYNIDVKVYNSKGQVIIAPGKKGKEHDDRVIELLNSLKADIYSEIGIRSYYSAIPIVMEKKCRFCHSRKKKNIAGVITFERGSNSFIYYTSERIIIFVLISVILAIFLYFVIKWDPERIAREMFDK